MADGPYLIAGGRHEDARGVLRFCNDFDMTPVKRFYTVSNSAEQPNRGWIMHKKETKWLFPLKGTTIIRIDPATDGRGRSPSGPRDQSFILTASNPAVLCVPPNHWFYIEQYEGAEVQVFSNCFVGEFENDNFRKDI